MPISENKHAMHCNAQIANLKVALPRKYFLALAIHSLCYSNC